MEAVDRPLGVGRDRRDHARDQDRGQDQSDARDNVEVRDLERLRGSPLALLGNFGERHVSHDGGSLAGLFEVTQAA